MPFKGNEDPFCSAPANIYTWRYAGVQQMPMQRMCATSCTLIPRHMFSVGVLILLVEGPFRMGNFGDLLGSACSFFIKGHFRR